jgi:hypothetical protein
MQTLQPTHDQRIVQPGRTWEQFNLIQKGFKNAPGVRLFYFDETIEALKAADSGSFGGLVDGCEPASLGGSFPPNPRLGDEARPPNPLRPLFCMSARDCGPCLQLSVRELGHSKVVQAMFCP